MLVATKATPVADLTSFVIITRCTPADRLLTGVNVAIVLSALSVKAHATCTPSAVIKNTLPRVIVLSSIALLNVSTTIAPTATAVAALAEMLVKVGATTSTVGIVTLVIYQALVTLRYPYRGRASS
jgi:hypothetical protein